MKNVIYGIMLTVIGILIVLIVITINGRMTRQKESTDALGQAVETTVENTMEQDNYTINDNKEFVADFLQNLLLQVENDSDVEVNIAGIDYKKGLLSVNVVEHFTHPSGKDAELSYSTTVVMEQSDADHYYTVNFYNVDGEVYKSYQLCTGSKVTEPYIPDVPGKTFVGWKDADGNEVDIDSVKVSGDMELFASYS